MQWNVLAFTVNLQKKLSLHNIILWNFLFSGEKTVKNERHNIITFQSLHHERIETSYPEVR